VPYPIGSGNYCTTDPDVSSGSSSGPTVTSWTVTSNCLTGYVRMKSVISAATATRYQVEYQVGSTWYSLYDGNLSTQNIDFGDSGTYNFRARAYNGSAWGAYSTKSVTMRSCSSGGIEP